MNSCYDLLSKSYMSSFIYLRNFEDKNLRALCDFGYELSYDFY